MVVCTYFLSNTCRFGSRCNNEHIDICALVKNEVEVTLKGNQWPLSCFGPFKDRNSIPNFIEDQSFEEIRMMYLEAKMQNNIPAHQMQLAQMINDAKGKLQRLATMSRDILGTLVELYNQQESSTKPTAGGNPFASIGTFGGAPGGTATASIFGTASSGGTFGSGPATGGSIFGGAFSGQATQSTGSIFGSASTAASANPFAAATQQQPVAGGSIFGMAQTPQQPSNSVFGAPPVLGSGIGLFSNVQQPAAATGNIFAAVGQPAAPTGGNIFTQTPSQQPASIFGQQQQQQQQGDMFASVGFSSAQPLSGGSLFNAVPFGSVPAPSPFGQSAIPTNSAAQSVFTPAPTAAPTPFGSSMAGGSVFGGAAPAPGRQSATMYSKLEEIPADSLAAFNADQFQLGRIPTMPPPKELCH
ncbi:hypothetical protein AND_009011 [Anopheles darlingi]|uniref:Nucleoporin NUP42 n=1 Tax=Anopheles darlingi TaxID=43151 RepID=W5J9E8_ANODA|nr:hypothetical protein AND_009011 [Anopheles darlingi]